MKSAVDKYLARWAEPEHRIAAGVSPRFSGAVVVPVVDETSELFDGLWSCARAGALVILIVNARQEAPERVQRANAELLGALPAGVRLSDDPPAWLTRRAGLDVLVVDRSSPGFWLPARHGVGLARRIGCDLALALHRASRLESPFIGSTDADAELPADYFDALSAVSPDAVAVTFPFVHLRSGDEALDRATELHERWLAHYVQGLERAGSPFAFHTVGSALAVRAEAYAQVRGFPKRLAGEDFHLLDKLAKLGPVVTARSAPIRIRARRSERVPFGTGPAVARIEAGVLPRFHPQRCFELLGVWLAALEAFSRHRDPARLRSDVSAHPPLASALESLGAFEAAAAECAEAPDAVRLSRRLRSSFGALRTLRLIRVLSDAEAPCVARPPQPASSQPDA